MEYDRPFLNLRMLIAHLQTDAVSIRNTVEEMLNEISRIRYDLEKEYNLSPVVDPLEYLLNSVDLNQSLSFIDDADDIVRELPFRLKKSYDSYKLAVNPILANTPVEFNQMFPPESEDFYVAEDER